jgi:glycine/D-amino acid oxidase-like deaminating enzyme
VEKTQELITFPFNIVHQEYGFRPTTPDRRPILGRHPALERVFTFNGMGTKGVSLAPYFSDILVRFVENGEPINKEVEIERYKLLYWTSP